MDVGDSILRQVAFKGAIEVYIKVAPTKNYITETEIVDAIEELTDNFHQILRKDLPK